MTKLKMINNSTAFRLAVALIVGVGVGTLAYISQLSSIAILLGWDAAVLTFVVWILCIIWPMNHERTARFALREDPSRVGADIILILSSIASLGAVGFALFEAHIVTDVMEQLFLTTVGMISVVLSWVLIHTIYALRYAELYYSEDFDGTVDFKKNNTPAYSDFIYLSFTLGMTFQVADTDLMGTEFRKIVLRHAILSYVFGTVIVAVTINLIAGLGR